MTRPLPWRSRIGGWIALAGVLLLACWLTGRLLTDRFLWSQYLFWIPSVLALTLGALALLASTFACRGRHAWGRRFILAACLISATAWTVLVEWRVFRQTAAPPGTPLRIMHWNLAAERMPSAAAFIRRFDADIAVLANPSFSRDADTLEQALGPDARAAHVGHCLLLVKGEVLERHVVSLGLGGRRAGMDPAKDGPNAIDHGWAAWAVVTIPGVDDPLTLWVVDLPNDPERHRPEMLAAAAGVMQSAAFPDADVLVGDFNTPRGSGSLALIAGDMQESHALAGSGPGASWPRRFPLWAIDLTFVRRGIGVDRSRVILPTEGTHGAQVVDVVVGAR